MTDAENLALLSKGADLHSVTAAVSHTDINRLIRFDELGFGDPDELTQSNGGEPRLLEPARRTAGWEGDSSIYFQEADQVEIVVKLGDESLLSRIGFMDTPWDRNYGRNFVCSVSLTAEEDDWIEYGSCAIEDIHRDRGDPNRYPLRNKWVEWDAARGEPPPALYVKYAWPDSNGKRVFHLYAYGSFAASTVLTVHVSEDAGSSRFAFTNMGGTEVASIHPVDPKAATLADLRAQLQKQAEIPAYSVKLAMVCGRFLKQSEDESKLADLFDI